MAVYLHFVRYQEVWKEGISERRGIFVRNSMKKEEKTNVKIGKTASVYAGEGRGYYAGAQALWSDLEKDGANEYKSIFRGFLWNHRT